ncbi:MAG: SEC-C domain-containing protein, partial [Planctomycetes bacterium]|nr:SEC-C domain-containing protein [Planctomycetota bacterium]
YKREATDTIRDVVTGRMRQAPPPQQQAPQMRMPTTPEELQQLFNQLLAAGRIPPEVVERMNKGERFVLRVTPQGLVLAPADAPPADAAAPAAGEASPPPAADAAPPAAPAQAAPPPPPPPAEPAAPPAPPRRLAPAAPMPAPRPAQPAPAPKAGRNDPCPCGSGLKFKKCCGSD